MKQYFTSAVVAVLAFLGMAAPSIDVEQAKSDAAGAIAYASLARESPLPPSPQPTPKPPAPPAKATAPVAVETKTPIGETAAVIGETHQETGDPSKPTRETAANITQPQKAAAVDPNSIPISQRVYPKPNTGWRAEPGFPVLKSVPTPTRYYYPTPTTYWVPEPSGPRRFFYRGR